MSNVYSLSQRCLVRSLKHFLFVLPWQQALNYETLIRPSSKTNCEIPISDYGITYIITYTTITVYRMGNSPLVALDNRELCF